MYEDWPTSCRTSTSPASPFTGPALTPDHRPAETVRTTRPKASTEHPVPTYLRRRGGQVGVGSLEKMVMRSSAGKLG